jgi:hypothetical protein
MNGSVGGSMTGFCFTAPEAVLALGEVLVDSLGGFIVTPSQKVS